MSEEGNIVYSCPEHGLEVYRKLKNNPSVPKIMYIHIFRQLL